MDFNFGTLVLGSAVNHGVEIGEAFYTASQIKDGNAASWRALPKPGASNPLPAATK